MKKLASLFLCVILILSACPLSVFATTGETQIATTIPEGVSELVSNPETNIVHSWKYSQIEDEALAYRVSYTYGSDINVALAASASQYTNVTNGNYDEVHTDISGFEWWDDNGNYKEGAYVDFTFNFPAEATITNILLASAQETIAGMGRQVNEYKVYAGNDLSTLYTETNVKAHYNPDCAETATYAQYITFGESISAKYVGIRILNCTKDQSNYTNTRLREIAIIGELVIPEEFKAISDMYVQPCIDALDTEYNLLNTDDYVALGGSEFPLNPPKGSITAFFINPNGGGQIAGACRVRSYEVESNDYFNHTLGNRHGDIANLDFHNGNGDESGYYNDGRYVMITIHLKDRAIIDKFFISHANDRSGQLITREYEVYVGDKFDVFADLYNDDNKVWSYFNENAKKNQVHEFEEPVEGTYVGIKVLNSVQPHCQTGSSYVRLDEIALFGKYDTDYYDYTVKSTGDQSLVNVNGNSYSGKTISASAPICKNGYTLSGWTINGEPLEATNDIYNNVSEVSFELTENDLAVVANYEPDATALSGNAYSVSKDNTKVLVPQGKIVYALRHGFNEPHVNIGVARGTADLTDKDYIAKGDTLKLASMGSTKQELEVVIGSDFNNNGTVSVSDIVDATSVIIGSATATADQTFAFDTNASGTLTVTDIIRARNSILTASETDYSNATVTMADAQFKTMGRSVKSGTSLKMDWTASGFIFNVDCYGDIYVNMSQEGSSMVGSDAACFYTVIVDGVESEIGVFGSATQDIKIAEGLSAGKHTIEFYKQSEGGIVATYNSINLNGEFLDKPVDKDLLIEYVGDSITCGAMNLVANGYEDSDMHNQNGYHAYGALTSRLLGADWSNISSSGSYLIADNVNSCAHMPTEYNFALRTPNLYDTDRYNNDYPWDFTTQRNADIVVVNLGTNDSGIIANRAGSDDEDVQAEYFADKAYEFAQQIIEANGEDVKIVFAAGMMRDENFSDKGYKLAIEKLANEDNFNNAFFCRLPTNTDGGSTHPNIQGNIDAANVLSKYIKENVIE